MATDKTEMQERVSFTERADDQKPDWDAEARKTGWRPQEEFQGAKEKWIDAEQWVKRGEQFIPFLQASKRELQARQENLENQLAESRRQNAAILASLNELKTDVGKQAETVTQERKAELVEAVVKAREDGDLRKELQLLDELADVNEQLRAAKAPKPAVTAPAAVGETPEFQAFVRDNPWFREDTVMAGAAVAAMGQLNADPQKVNWPADRKLAEVAKTIKQRFGLEGNSRRSQPSRVEGSRPEGGRGEGGKTFEDLPPDARSTCDTLSKRFVGKPDAAGNIKYPDLASYRAKYTRDYFSDDWGNLAQMQ